MAQININLGTPPSGQDGDPVRTAFEKTNTMFAELYKLTQGELTALNAVDVQTIVKPGSYYITNGVNRPAGAGNGYLFVVALAGANEVYHRFVNVNLSGSWEQVKLAGTWRGWNPNVYGTKVASATDTAADRIVTTGFQGLGGRAVGMTDWTEDFKKGCGFFQANAAATGGPGPAGYNVTGINVMLNSGPIGAQIGVFNGANRMVFRSAYNAFLPWMEVVHSGNATLDPQTNVGALMYYGFNANGEFWKYANGMLICKVNRTVSITVGTQATGVFFGAGPVWNFPHGFVGNNPPTVFGSTVSAGQITWDLGGLPNLSAVQISVCSMQALPARDFVQSLIAIGRWK